MENLKIKAKLICLYLPPPECTADKNFVFAVHNDFANIPVNPMNLMVAGKTGCKPVISNKDFAIFKFSVTECGTHSFVSILMSRCRPCTLI